MGVYMGVYMHIKRKNFNYKGHLKKKRTNIMEKMRTHIYQTKPLKCTDHSNETAQYNNTVTQQK